MHLKDVNHVNIIVKNFENSRFFFESFLGLEKHSSDDRAYLVGEEGPILVALEFPLMEAPDLKQDKHQCFRSISFVVESIRDVVHRALECNLEPFLFENDGDSSPITLDCLEDIKTISIRDSDTNLWQFIEAET